MSNTIIISTPNGRTLKLADSAKIVTGRAPMIGIESRLWGISPEGEAIPWPDNFTAAGAQPRVIPEEGLALLKNIDQEIRALEAKRKELLRKIWKKARPLRREDCINYREGK